MQHVCVVFIVEIRLKITVLTMTQGRNTQGYKRSTITADMRLIQIHHTHTG